MAIATTVQSNLKNLLILEPACIFILEKRASDKIGSPFRY